MPWSLKPVNPYEVPFFLNCLLVSRRLILSCFRMVSRGAQIGDTIFCLNSLIGPSFVVFLGTHTVHSFGKSCYICLFPAAVILWRLPWVVFSPNGSR